MSISSTASMLCSLFSRRPAGSAPATVYEIVIWDGVSYRGIVIPCRPIGLLRVEQTNITSHARERNDRLAALPIKAPRWDSVRSIFDVGERVRRELEQFFLAAVAFEGKDLKILGWAGP